jgi:hypothetical protein
LEKDLFEEFGLFYDLNTGSYHCRCLPPPSEPEDLLDDPVLRDDVAQFLQDWRQFHAQMAVFFDWEPE